MESFVDQFLNIYRNEKNTRKLLPSHQNTIRELLIQIKYQEEYIDQIKEQKQLKAIYEQEIEYLKFIIADYLKVRINKIQKDFYISEINMSENELIFHKKLKEKYKKLDIYVEKTHNYEDIECIGFIALEDIGSVVIEGKIIDISLGDFFVVQYKEIEYLLYDMKILLV